MNQDKEKPETVVENGAVCINPKVDPAPVSTIKEAAKVQVVNGVVMVQPPDTALSKDEEIAHLKNLLKKATPFLEGELLAAFQKAIKS